MPAVFSDAEILLRLSAEHIETEELALILGILTFKMSICYLAAIDKLCKTDKLTKLALKVKAVSLVSYQEYVTLTGVNNNSVMSMTFLQKPFLPLWNLQEQQLYILCKMTVILNAFDANAK